MELVVNRPTTSLPVFVPRERKEGEINFSWLLPRRNNRSFIVGFRFGECNTSISFVRRKKCFSGRNSAFPAPVAAVSLVDSSLYDISGPGVTKPANFPGLRRGCHWPKIPTPGQVRIRIHSGVRPDSEHSAILSFSGRDVSRGGFSCRNRQLIVPKQEVYG